MNRSDDKKSPFIYLLNAMENAAQASDPSTAGYGLARREVLEYVEALEKRSGEAVERDLANASAFAASETARAGKILSALEDCSLALSQARQDNEAMASRLFDLEKRCSESDKRRAHD